MSGVDGSKEACRYSIELDLTPGEAKVVDVDLAKVGEGKWPAEINNHRQSRWYEESS